MKKLSLISGLFTIFISCASSPKFIAPDYSRPQKVAILPIINQTSDVEGSIIFRNLLSKGLKTKKYANLKEIQLIDSILNEAGITDGGQLYTINQNELFEMLKVDGLFYVKLLVCESTPLDPFKTGEIKANFKLYKSPSKLIWEDERGEKAKSRSIKLSDNLSDLFKSYTKKVKEDLIEQSSEAWIEDHELKEEMEKLIKKSLKTLR